MFKHTFRPQKQRFNRLVKWIKKDYSDYNPHHKVADTPFNNQGDDLLPEHYIILILYYPA